MITPDWQQSSKNCAKKTNFVGFVCLFAYCEHFVLCTFILFFNIDIFSNRNALCLTSNKASKSANKRIYFHIFNIKFHQCNVGQKTHLLMHLDPYKSASIFFTLHLKIHLAAVEFYFQQKQTILKINIKLFQQRIIHFYVHIKPVESRKTVD